MDNKKVLAYFNIQKKAKLDSFCISFMAGMDLGISAFFFLELLAKIVSPSLEMLFFGVVGILIDLLFILWGKLTENPVMECPILFLVSVFSAVKLCIISFLTYPFEQRMLGISLGIEYAAPFIITVCLAGIIIAEKLKALSLLKKFSIEEAQKKLADRKINKWRFPIACVPGGALFMYRLLRGSFQPSITFCSWALSSVFFFFALITGYNLVMAMRFHLLRVYKET